MLLISESLRNMFSMFWQALDRNVFAVGDDLTGEEKHRRGVACLKASLFAWYKQKSCDFEVTQLQNLTVKMLGTKARPSLRTKAAETKGLLFFAVDFAEQHGLGRATLGAGQALCKYMTVVSIHGLKMPRAAVQDPTVNMYMPPPHSQIRKSRMSHHVWETFKAIVNACLFSYVHGLNIVEHI